MPTPSLPLSSRGRATRERLLTAARKVFEERGFVDTRIAHIASTAGVAYGSFYTHFPSKEAIFYEVASRLFDEMFATDPSTSRPASPRERLEQANRNYCARYRENAALMAIVEQVATIDEGFRTLRQSHRRTTTERTARSIRRWQAEGLVSTDLDAYVAAQALGAMVDRTLYLRYVLGESDANDNVVDTLNLLTVQALGLPRD
ncbi:TetR/AcrR family transcriptional regulator [Micromonospora sp. NPDC023814]|uniref:TetR/AcrR family transcriptional regulator n=1 Tax=Micromonospora sp. NPDC023814 TaxID=3154596 RepID=UPI0033FDC372